MLGRLLTAVRFGSAEKKDEPIARTAKIPKPDIYIADDADLHVVDDKEHASIEKESKKIKATELVAPELLIETEYKNKDHVLIDTPATIRQTLAKEDQHQKQKKLKPHRIKHSLDKKLNFDLIEKSEVPADSDVIETDKPQGWGILIDTPDSLASRLKQEEADKLERAKTKKTNQKINKIVKIQHEQVKEKDDDFVLTTSADKDPIGVVIKASASISAKDEGGVWTTVTKKRRGKHAAMFSAGQTQSEVSEQKEQDGIVSLVVNTKTTLTMSQV